jgi:hypothetical protein
MVAGLESKGADEMNMWQAGYSMLVLLVVVPQLARAVTLGQVDTFEDGTTMGWYVPGASPNPPANVPAGGPQGPGDAYLQLQANGIAGPGGRLSVLNDAQWTGNYLSAGVTVIRMNVNNFGPEDLHLRLLFETFTAPGPPTNLALSADAIFVPAGSGWMTVDFPITPDDLVVETLGTVIGALSDTGVLRIFHNPNPSFPGPSGGIPTINVTLGVDNITAVPEPWILLQVAVGLLSVLFARSWSRRNR